jgi:hypothetical protein
MKATVRGIYAEASEAEDSQERKAIADSASPALNPASRYSRVNSTPTPGSSTSSTALSTCEPGSCGNTTERI